MARPPSLRYCRDCGRRFPQYRLTAGYCPTCAQPRMAAWARFCTPLSPPETAEQGTLELPT